MFVGTFVGTFVVMPPCYRLAIGAATGGGDMGKRARRRAREQQATVDERRVSADAVLARRSRSDSVVELCRLVDGRRVIDRRIEDIVDQLVAKGVGWVPIADALGVTRQAARQTFLRRSRSGH
jgi:hypothetical protein